MRNTIFFRGSLLSELSGNMGTAGTDYAVLQKDLKSLTCDFEESGARRRNRELYQFPINKYFNFLYKRMGQVSNTIYFIPKNAAL